jgi:hypothetical protein
VTSVPGNRAETPPPVVENNEVILSVGDLREGGNYLNVPGSYQDYGRRKSSLGQLTR